MKKEKVLILGVLFFNTFLTIGQSKDSVLLKINAAESRELRDFYGFEEIDYFKTTLIGEDIENGYFILTSDEYWNGELSKTDTIANTKEDLMKNGSDTLNIRVMSKKIDSETMKFNFFLPRIRVIHNYKTTAKDTYSVRDITTQGDDNFAANKPINLLVLSLPYEDPERPGYLLYCELSREGTPPEKWGEKFGVEHYIVFKLQLIN